MELYLHGFYLPLSFLLELLHKVLVLEPNALHDDVHDAHDEGSFHRVQEQAILQVQEKVLANLQEQGKVLAILQEQEKVLAIHQELGKVQANRLVLEREQAIRLVQVKVLAILQELVKGQAIRLVLEKVQANLLEQELDNFLQEMELGSLLEKAQAILQELVQEHIHLQRLALVQKWLQCNVNGLQIQLKILLPHYLHIAK